MQPGQQASRVLLAPQVPPEVLGRMDHRALPGRLVLQVSRVIMGPWALLEIGVLPVNRDRRENKVYRDRPVKPWPLL